GGEDVDARAEPLGWSAPGARDDGWRQATPVAAPGGTLCAQSAPPVRVQQTFNAVHVSEPKPGVFVYDLGSNFARRPLVLLQGQSGAQVRIIPSEVLAEDGTFWQRSFNAGPGRMVEYNYTLAGGDAERFAPRFSYHGFRYLQIEGAAPADRRRADVPEI